MIKLENPVELESGKTYRVRIQFNNDVAEEKEIAEENGVFMEVNALTPFSAVAQEYDNYSVGEETKVKKDYRILALQMNIKNEVDFGIIEHNSNVFDPSAVSLPSSVCSALRLDISDVEGLTLSERLVKLKDGTIENVIDVWFQKPANYSYFLKKYNKARIYISDDDGENWIPRGECTEDYFSIQGDIKDLRTYIVAVVSVDNRGMEKEADDSPQATITVVGKSADPSDVEYFNAAQVEDKILLSWQAITDVDVKGYELREGVSWSTAMEVDTVFDGTKKELPTFLPGTRTYWLKAIDTSDNYSQNAISVTLVITRRPGINAIWTSNDVFGLGIPDQLFLDEKFQVSWENLYDNSYFRQIVEKKTINKWDTWDMDWESAESGEYEWDWPKDTASVETPIYYYWITKVIDMGSIYADVMHSFSIAWKVDKDIISVVEMRSSEDGSTWTNWEIYTPGFIIARYTQFRGTITSINAYSISKYFDSLFLADVPDIEVVESEIAIAAGGTTVVFPRSFTVAPAIFVTAMKASTPLIPEVSDVLVTTSQFHCRLRNPETTAYEAAKINYRAKGY